MRALALAAVAAAVIYVSAARAQEISLQDRAAIIDVITDVAAGADRHDWERVRAAFAERVTLDYTSLWGGEPAPQTAEVVAQWSSFLPGFDATLHLVTNHTIVSHSPDAAVAEADFQAAHRLQEGMWTLMGHYRYDLVRRGGRWKIERMVMTWTHEAGDRGLVQKAAAHAARPD